MIIRKATSADIPQMLKLGKMMHSEFHYSRFDYDENKVEFLMKFAVREDPHNMYIALVAEEDYEIQGGIIAKVEPMYFGKDLMAADFALFLAPEHRGNLTAMSIIKEYVKMAKEKGAKYVILGSTTGHHTDRIARLFERMGGKLVGPVYEF